jgi:hypothetical protein
LDNYIHNAKTAEDWHKFSTAKHRLFEQWRILVGIPLPGSRRPAAEKARSRSGLWPSGPIGVAPIEDSPITGEQSPDWQQ